MSLLDSPTVCHWIASRPHDDGCPHRGRLRKGPCPTPECRFGEPWPTLTLLPSDRTEEARARA